MGINNLGELGKHFQFEEEQKNPKRGEIYYVDLADMAVGTIHIAQKSRPALIIQNDKGNLYGNTVIVAFLTTVFKKDYPMHYDISLNGKQSIIQFEQIMTLDKNRLGDKVGELTFEQMQEADEVLMYSLQLNRFSLYNVKDIDVIAQNTTKSRTGTNVNFDINIMFAPGEAVKVNILLSKLQEFDNSITADIDFDELKHKLDCCKGLNWLVKNNRL